MGQLDFFRTGVGSLKFTGKTSSAISWIQDVTQELFIINLLQVCMKSEHSLQLPVQYFAKQSEAP